MLLPLRMGKENDVLGLKDAGERRELWAFGWKVLQALARVIAICLFAGTHWLVTLILQKLVMSKFPKVDSILEGLAVVAFGFLYCLSLADMVFVFLPKSIQEALRVKIASKNGGHDETSGARSNQATASN